MEGEGRVGGAEEGDEECATRDEASEVMTRGTHLTAVYPALFLNSRRDSQQKRKNQNTEEQRKKRRRKNKTKQKNTNQNKTKQNLKKSPLKKKKKNIVKDTFFPPTVFLE